MSGAYWKDRFSEKQLERKRLSDKISQRRARQQLKQNTAELEYRVRLLTDGETATLINRIQQENALLRSKIWRYRAQMENIFLQGKDCLMQDEPSWADLDAPIMTRSPHFDTKREPMPGSSIDSKSDPQSPTYRSIEQRCIARLLKFQPSLYVELAKLIGRPDGLSDEIETNDILEAIMMWKAKFGLEPNEFAVLLVSLNLDQEPFHLTAEKVKEQAMSKHLFQDIMQNLIYGEELSPRVLTEDDKIPDGQLSKKQCQRRAIAYCAYETLRAWRDCFKSPLEYVALFWAQYRYFMVLAFPTLENYHRCPTWRRPIAEQFNHDHPSIVDLLVWPKLREILVSTWQNYELQGLCVSLVRSLEFMGVQKDVATVIKLQSDSSDVILEEAFEREVHEICNFSVLSMPFTKQFPDLAAAITVEPKILPQISDPWLLKDHEDQESAGQMLAGVSRQDQSDFEARMFLGDLPDIQAGSVADSTSASSNNPLDFATDYPFDNFPNQQTTPSSDQDFQGLPIIFSEDWTTDNMGSNLSPYFATNLPDNMAEDWQGNGIKDMHMYQSMDSCGIFAGFITEIA